MIEEQSQKQSGVFGTLFGENNELELQPFEVSVLEIKFSTGYIRELFERIAQAEDPAIYDNKLIKFFLEKVNYIEQIFWLVFIPFSVYASALFYYYCFVLSDY